jgi:hypothetical protein
MIEHLKSVGARAQWLSRDLGQQWRRDPQTKVPYALQSKQEWKWICRTIHQAPAQAIQTHQKKENLQLP